jgi:hypothetical protein
MSITRMTLWVQLPNFPFHSWYISIFEDIENTLGSYIKAILEIYNEIVYIHDIYMIFIPMHELILQGKKGPNPNKKNWNFPKQPM